MEVNEPAVPYYRKMSAETYLKWEREQTFKHEYIEGEIIDMAGASLAHNYIYSNLFREISSFLKGKLCNVFGSDLRVEVKSKESYFYPDIVIVCDDVEIADEKKDMIKNPAIVIEILSPSTERYDAKRKKFFYMQMPSLKEYIMIDSASISADILRKTGAGKWENEVFIDRNALLTIATISFSIPLTEVYKNVQFYPAS